ncbi:MAG: phasin family protein [Polaromonas sp.]|nr:phasin family protein [Polaromonas sp.]
MTTQTSRHVPDSPASSHSSKGVPARVKHVGRSSPQASGNYLDSWNVLTELGRQQMAAATLGTSALCRGSEALRKVQQDIAHEASLRHAQVAKKLASPCQPAVMMELQTELMRSNIESVTQYWQQLLEVALHTQREMMEGMTGLVDGKSDSGMKSVLEAFQSIVPPMATSFFAPSHPGASGEPH